MSVLESAIFEKIRAFRRHLHANPELSLEETATSAFICKHLDELGIRYKTLAGTGIVADFDGPSDSKRVAFRADIDALPIVEETGLDFASQTDGVMHACGHDGHASILYGLALLLSKEKQLPVSVRLIFQPAEEIAVGAKAMIDAGVLQDVDMIFGLHIDRHYPVGTVMVSDDYVNAASDKFSIRVSGESGHAARPHEAVDAVVVGSLIVSSLQTIVSREVDPAHPSVVTIGKFEAGTAANVIAGQALLEGTIRTLDTDVREYITDAITRIAEFAGKLHGAHVEAEFRLGTPSLKNDSSLVPLAKQAVVNAVGNEQLVPKSAVNMGGEDFSYYLNECPGVMVRLGGQFKDKESFPAHSSRFDFDEQALAVGTRYYYELVRCVGDT